MKRSFTSNIVLFAGFLCTLVAATTSARAQSSTAIYDVKYSEIFPEKAAQYRKLIRQTRERFEAEIRGARAAEQRRQMIQRARELMQELAWQIKLECPPTTFVLHGNPSHVAIDEAMGKLRSGALQVGGKVYIREKNPVGNGAAVRPPTGTRTRKGSNSILRPTPPNSTRQTGPGAAAAKKSSPTTTRPGVANPNIPNFGGLNGGPFPMPKPVNNGSTGLFGT